MKRELTTSIQLYRCTGIEEMCRTEEKLIAVLRPFLNILGNTEVLDFSGYAGPYDKPDTVEPPSPSRRLKPRSTGGPTIDVSRARYDAVMSLFSSALG